MLPAYDFALAIPTLNEAGNIPVLLDRLQKALQGSNLNCEILVVDDDSRDGTAQLVTDYARSHPNVRLFVRRRQRGLAGAVIHGWAHTDAKILAVIDADLQHPPELLPHLIAKVGEGADIAIASRYAEKRSVKGFNAARHAVSRLGTLICMPFQKDGLRVHDPLSGFFALRRHCIEGVHLQPEGFKLLLEILARGNFKSVVEVPFEFGQRYAGESKAGLMTGVHYLTLLRKLSRDALRATRRAA